MEEHIIKQLWYNYFLDQCGIINGKEEKESLSRTVALEKELLAELSPKQKKKVEEFAEAIHDANSFLVEKAFICGIRFTTKYLMEVMEL